MIKVDLPSVRKVHFVGIGGAGMIGLANMIADTGRTVTGSDKVLTAKVLETREKGIKIHENHDASNIETDTDLVIHTAAATPDNPELEKARELNIPTISYPQAVGLLTRNYNTISICGTHGKTTTTSMLAAAFIKLNQDPTVIVGAEIAELNNKSYRLGQSEYFILESCEYKRHFLNYIPKYIIINNAEPDHLDYYHDEYDYISAYMQFSEHVLPGGFIVCNIDDNNVRKIIARSKKKIVTFGKSVDAMYQLKGKDVYYHGELLTEINLKLPGEHNLYNALGVIALINELKLPLKEAIKAINNFTGAKRRMEHIGTLGHTEIYDDYAHHPTEIKASLSGFRSKYPDKKILCIFQPHQFSRTIKLFDDFVQSFENANTVIIPDIYQVRDTAEDIQSMTTQKLVDEINQHHQDCRNGNGLENTLEWLKNNYSQFDVIITMGAGPVTNIAQKLVNDAPNN